MLLLMDSSAENLNELMQVANLNSKQNNSEIIFQTFL